MTKRLKLFKLILFFIIVINSVSYSQNKNISDIYSFKKELNKYEYNLLIFMSLETCLTCNLDKLILPYLDIDSINIILSINDILNQKEIVHLKKKFYFNNIYSKSDNFLYDYYNPRNKNVVILLDNNGIQINSQNLVGGGVSVDQLLENSISLSKDSKSFITGNGLLINPKVIRYLDNNESFFVLDRSTNTIFHNEIKTGKSIGIYILPDYISNFIKNKDSTGENWKWKYKIPAKIINFVANEKSRIKSLVEIPYVNVDTADTMVNIMTGAKLFLVDMYSDTCFIIKKYFSNCYPSIYHEQAIPFNNHILAPGRDPNTLHEFNIGSGSKEDTTNYTNDIVLVVTDTNFANCTKVLDTDSLKKIIKNNYFPLFIPFLTSDNKSKYALYSPLNSVLITFQFIDNKITNIKQISPFGILKTICNYVNKFSINDNNIAKISPEFEKTRTYKFIDFIISDNNIYMLLFNESAFFSKGYINSFVLQVYSIDGLSSYERKVFLPNDDKLLKVKEITVINSKLYLLLKWKTRGWQIHHINLPF